MELTRLRSCGPGSGEHSTRHHNARNAWYTKHSGRSHPIQSPIQSHQALPHPVHRIQGMGGCIVMAVMTLPPSLGERSLCQEISMGSLDSLRVLPFSVGTTSA